MLRITSQNISTFEDQVNLNDGDMEWDAQNGYNSDQTQTVLLDNSGSTMSPDITREKLIALGRSIASIQSQLMDLAQYLVDNGQLPSNIKL